MGNKITYLIIFLIFFSVGMILGIVLRPNNEYHGPNALAESKKIYYDNIKGVCIKFAIVPINCPKPKKRYQKIFDFINKKLNILLNNKLYNK